jgi:hypothetical protein
MTEFKKLISTKIKDDDKKQKSSKKLSSKKLILSKKKTSKKLTLSKKKTSKKLTLSKKKTSKKLTSSKLISSKLTSNKLISTRLTSMKSLTKMSIVEPKTISEYEQTRQEESRKKLSKFAISRRAYYRKLYKDKRTYMILGFMGLNQNMLRLILNNMGMVEVKKNPYITEVDFLYMELDYYKGSLYDRYGYTVNAELKNLIDDSKRKIDKKNTLYVNMMEYFPKYAAEHFARTVYLEDLDEITNNDVWIIKLVDGYLGKDMQIVDNNQRLGDVKESLLNKYGLHKVVASEYIKNITLFDGKKMHLRFYLLVSSFDKKIYVFDRAEIVVAIKKYVLANYTDMDIHDTHFGRTVIALPDTPKRFFPDEFPDNTYEITDKIMGQINEFAKKLEYIMHQTKPEVGVFDGYEYGYQVFSCDCLVQDNYNLIVLELGDKPSFFEKYPVRDRVDPLTGPWTEHYTQFCYDYYQWIFKHGIQPILFKEKEKEKSSKKSKSSKSTKMTK